MNYRLVQQLQEKAVAVTHSCRVLAVSRSGYYEAKRRRLRPPVVCSLSVHLKSVFMDSGRCYGSRRLQRALIAKGLTVGRYRVRSLMQQHGFFNMVKDCYSYD